jgi:RNA polymerase sigma-70 factor (ECF subfamily)
LEEFPELIEEYEPMVFRMLARLTGEREGLEDMAQEVFLRLFRALPHFRGRAKLSTFLYRIIVNVVNDEWRRRQVARRMEPIDEEVRELVHPSAGPAEILEQSRFQQALEGALMRLPLRDRTILALHYQEGRSYEEVAAVLELPMGTVKTHLHRARERLKAQMGDWISRCKTTH